MGNWPAGHSIWLFKTGHLTSVSPESWIFCCIFDLFLVFTVTDVGNKEKEMCAIFFLVKPEAHKPNVVRARMGWVSRQNGETLKTLLRTTKKSENKVDLR